MLLNVLSWKLFRKHCWRRHSIFPLCFTPFDQLISLQLLSLGIFYELSANIFQFRQYEILLYGKELTFPNWQILNSSKLKEFADDNIKFDKKDRMFSKRGKQDCLKRRNCLLKAISLFPTVFSRDLPSGLKRILCRVLVKRTPGKHG